MKCPLYIYSLFIILFLAGCIDSFTPEINSHEDLLVVDALITNEPVPQVVKLSRTITNQNDTPESVTEAIVSITDSDGKLEVLNELTPGVYVTNPQNFIGKVGVAYTLNIQTSNGTIYESDACTMYPVPEIDSIYYYQESEFLDNGTTVVNGVKIAMETNIADIPETKLRWTFEEAWKFAVIFPSIATVRWEEIEGEDDAIRIVDEIGPHNEFCWKFGKSNEILLQSVNYVSPSSFQKELYFIDPRKSDRLSLRYCMLLKQYSLSEAEYSFWNKLQETNQIDGDIFAKQPFSVTGNINNLEKPDEQVLGYFQVSAVTTKPIFVNGHDLDRLLLDNSTSASECAEIGLGGIFEDYQIENNTERELYNMAYNLDFRFVRTQFGSLVFSSKECVDCRETGSINPPSYWIEYE